MTLRSCRSISAANVSSHFEAMKQSLGRKYTTFIDRADMIKTPEESTTFQKLETATMNMNDGVRTPSERCLVLDCDSRDMKVGLLARAT